MHKLKSDTTADPDMKQILRLSSRLAKSLRKHGVEFHFSMTFGPLRLRQAAKKTSARNGLKRLSNA
jgi:hypothetical protein